MTEGLSQIPQFDELFHRRPGGPPRHDIAQGRDGPSVGDDKFEHQRIRLSCLVEAGRQASLDCAGYADLLYRAECNARFVLYGEVPKLVLRDAESEKQDA